MNNKVSIIITTYGGKEDVIAAVESCINQSYCNTEIIVVDDSGEFTEKQLITEDYLKKYIKNNQIVYIKHKKNINASAARNTGIKKATGKYIALLDDDDVFLEDKIKRQVECFESLDESYGIVYCGMIDYSNQVYEYVANEDGDVLFKFLMMKVPACTSNIMFRKKDWEELGGFDENFRRHQDWEFLVRFANRKKFFGLNYIGTKKFTKDVKKRFNASKAEIFRLKYIELIKNNIERLDAKQQRKVLSHEYNEIAKLFFREKKLGKVFFYLGKSKRVDMFLIDILKNPLKKFKYNKQIKKDGKIVINYS